MEAMMEKYPFITIVMPVYNEGDSIADTLGQLLQQEYPPDRFEVLVCDGESTDGTRSIVNRIAKSDSRVRLRDNPGKRSSAGRNVGFRAGKGTIFVVVDGHCYIPSDLWLKNVARAFMQTEVDCLGRPQPLDPPGINHFQQAVAFARASRIGHGASSLIYCDYEGYASPVSNGAAYRREVFECVGYVDESFDACEDVEFNYRVEQAGLRAYTSPKFTVKYYPRDSFSGLCKQMIRYGVGRFRFMKKHPTTLSVSTLVPPLFAGGLGFCIVSLLVWAWRSQLSFAWSPAVFVIPYLFYIALVLGESIRIAKREDWRLMKQLPGVFFAIHFGLGFGFLAEAARQAASSLLKKTFQTAVL